MTARGPFETVAPGRSVPEYQENRRPIGFEPFCHAARRGEDLHPLERL